MFIVPISQMAPLSAAESTPAAQAIGSSAGIPFQDIFQEAVKDARETQAVSEQDAYNLAMGKTDDLHTVMINSEKAATALELTVQLTTRAVNAYNEIMRMQV